MKKLLLLLTVALIAFIYLYRQRIYLRDPIATVTRDGTKLADSHVMINAANDILLFEDSQAPAHPYLVQHWNKALSTPSVPLKCLHGMACMTDAAQASAALIPPGSRGTRPAFEGITMTDRHVEFVDEHGALVLVTLY